MTGNEWQYAFYARDRWQVNSKLTLNLGLRFDYYSPFSEVAMSTVRVVPDPTIDCTDIIGKVFDDNRELDEALSGRIAIEAAILEKRNFVRVSEGSKGRSSVSSTRGP